MTEVIVKGGDFEKALNQFKKLCFPIFKELRLRKAFESKPEKRRRKMIASRRRKAKALRRAEQIKRMFYRAK